MGRVADWVDDETLAAVEAALKSPADRLALRVSRHTGLRIGDVLALEARQLERQRISVREAKTGKRRRVYLPRGLWQALRDVSGRNWVFEGMTPLRHRSYDALWLDLRQAVRSVGLREAVSAHSWRKGYAVAKYRETGSIEAVRRLMGHDSETVTMLYALADVLTRDRLLPPRGEAGQAAGGGAATRQKTTQPAAQRHGPTQGQPPRPRRPKTAKAPEAPATRQEAPGTPGQDPRRPRPGQEDHHPTNRPGDRLETGGSRPGDRPPKQTATTDCPGARCETRTKTMTK